MENNTKLKDANLIKRDEYTHKTIDVLQNTMRDLTETCSHYKMHLDTITSDLSNLITEYKNLKDFYQTKLPVLIGEYSSKIKPQLIQLEKIETAFRKENKDFFIDRMVMSYYFPIFVSLALVLCGVVSILGKGQLTNTCLSNMQAIYVFI